VGRRRLIDLENDLLDSVQAAELIGLTSSNAFNVYIARYSDFPEPVVVRTRCKLWLRQDIEKWQQRHPRVGRKARPDDDQDDIP
jgi:predicted DNA-binding transcriptional regulator AlpA